MLALPPIHLQYTPHAAFCQHCAVFMPGEESMIDWDFIKGWAIIFGVVVPLMWLSMKL